MIKMQEYSLEREMFFFEIAFDVIHTEILLTLKYETIVLFPKI